MHKFFGCLSLLCLAILMSCDKKQSDTVNLNELVVGVSPDMPPFEFSIINDQAQQIVGFDIDLIKKIGQEINMPVRIESMPFLSLIPALHTKRVNVVISCIGESPARRKVVDFSIPYVTINIAGISLKKYANFALADMHDMRVGAQIGTNHEQFLKRAKEKDDSIQVVLLKDLGIIIQEVIAQRIDIAIIEESSAAVFAKTYPMLNYATIKATTEEFVIALEKNSPLIVKVNCVIKKLQSTGYIENLKRKWLH